MESRRVADADYQEFVSTSTLPRDARSKFSQIEVDILFDHLGPRREVGVLRRDDQHIFSNRLAEPARFKDPGKRARGNRLGCVLDTHVRADGKAHGAATPSM